MTDDYETRTRLSALANRSTPSRIALENDGFVFSLEVSIEVVANPYDSGWVLRGLVKTPDAGWRSFAASVTTEDVEDDGRFETVFSDLARNIRKAAAK